jgi:hypothetical protein
MTYKAVSLIAKISFLVTITVITGCANGKFIPSEVKTPGYRTIDNTSLSANLEEIDGDWRFTNIGTTNAGKDPNGYNVILGDYRVVSTQDYDRCSRGFFGLTSGDCSNTSEQSLRHILFMPLFWPFYLVGAIFEPTNDAHYFPVIMHQEFGWDKYMARVKEAKSAGNYDSLYPPIYEDYVKLKNAKRETVGPEYNKNKYESAAIRDLSEKKEETRSDLESQMAFRIVDESKIADVSSLKLLLEKSFEVAEVYLPQPPRLKEYDYISFLEIPDVESKVAPAKDLIDLRKKIDQFSTELVEIRTQNQRISLKNGGVQERTDIINNSILDNYRKNLASNSGQATITYTDGLISNISQYDYVFDQNYSSPGYRVNFDAGKLSDSDQQVVLTIKSRHYNYVYPEEYTSQNNEIAIKKTENKVEITNKTDKFITIDAVSLYYRGTVLTKGGANFQDFSELPPNTNKTFSFYDFDLNSLNDDYRSITKSIALRTDVTFGFAVKYRITEQGAPKTLYREDKHRLYDLIQ